MQTHIIIDNLRWVML